MPSVSIKQKNLMAACAHGAGYSKCPPTNVAREYNAADQGLLHPALRKLKKARLRIKPHSQTHASLADEPTGMGGAYGGGGGM